MRFCTVLGIALLTFSLNHSAGAAEINHVFNGTITITTAAGAQTVPDQLTLTNHTRKNGKILPHFETLEVFAGQTIKTTFTKAVPLPKGEGFTFEMSGSQNGGPVQKLGQFVAIGKPGAFTSFHFEHNNVIGMPTLFQTGTGSVTYATTGVATMTRDESIVTGAGATVQKIHSVVSGK